MFFSAFVLIALGFVSGVFYSRLRRPNTSPANTAPQTVIMIVGPITEQR